MDVVQVELVHVFTFRGCCVIICVYDAKVGVSCPCNKYMGTRDARKEITQTGNII